MEYLYLGLAVLGALASWDLVKVVILYFLQKRRLKQFNEQLEELKSLESSDISGEIKWN